MRKRKQALYALFHSLLYDGSCEYSSTRKYSHTLFPTHVLRPSCSRRNHSLLQLYPYSYPITFSSPLTCLINLSQDGEKEGLKTPSTSGKVPKQYDMTRKSKLELGEGTLAQCFPKVLPQTDQPAPSIRAPDEEAETGSTGSAKASMPAYNDVALYWDSQLYEYPGRYYESHKIFIALPHPTAAMASQAVGHESTRNVHRHHHLTRHQDAAKSLNPLSALCSTNNQHPRSSGSHAPPSKI